jgi:excisionase family DNA binding protein
MTFAPDRCYRASEIWRGAHVPRSMVYAALEAGELRAVRRGRTYLVPGAAVLSWLEALGQ